MPVVRVLEQAAREVEEAAAHYEKERPGLGYQFQDALQEALSLLSEELVPLTTIGSTLTSKGIQRLLMRRFPYALVVRRVGDDVVEVVAVAHHSRRPGYWLDRLST